MGSCRFRLFHAGTRARRGQYFFLRGQPEDKTGSAAEEKNAGRRKYLSLRLRYGKRRATKVRAWPIFGMDTRARAVRRPWQSALLHRRLIAHRARPTTWREIL